VDRLANLSTVIIDFQSAGTLPSASSTLAGYAANVLSFTASKTKEALENTAKDKLFSDSYIARFKGSSGVNLDEELANTITYQNAYTASARIISVTKELFDILFDTIVV
ncbi:MAG: flagellar basal body rod C-terminal domain-containing protein, partial [Burkholderiales bacterium]